MGLLDRIRSSVKAIFEGRESEGESKGIKNDENSFNASDDASTDYDNDTSVEYVKSIDEEGNIVGQDGYTYSKDEYRIDEDGLVLDEDGFMIGKLKPDMVHLRGKGLGKENEESEDKNDIESIEKDIKKRVTHDLGNEIGGIEVTDVVYKKHKTKRFGGSETTIKVTDENGLKYELVDLTRSDFNKVLGPKRWNMVEVRRHIKVFYPEGMYADSDMLIKGGNGYSREVVLDEFHNESNALITQRPEGEIHEYVVGDFKKWILKNREYMETVEKVLTTIREHPIVEIGVIDGSLNRNNILLLDLYNGKIRVIGKNKGLETVLEVGSKGNLNRAYTLRGGGDIPIGNIDMDEIDEYINKYEQRKKLVDVKGKSVKESLDILYNKLKDGKSKVKVYKNNPDKKDKLRFDRLEHLLKSKGIEFKTGKSESLGNYFTVNIGKGFVLNVTPTTIIDAKESKEMYYKFGDYTYSDLTRKTTKLVKERTGNDKEIVMRVIEFIKLYKLSNDLRRNIM